MEPNSVKVLVVEDDAFQRSVTVNMLRTIGLQQILEAANGLEALASLDGGASGPLPDVIFCDLDMPEMDGVEFLRAVAERKLARGIVIVSGHESEILRSVEAMVRASGLAVLGRVKKPLSKDHLRQLLSRDLPAASETPEIPQQPVDASELRRAVAARELHAEFQPKVNLTSDAILGAEALARWKGPGSGWVPPAQFIPVAVSEGLITPLTELMLDHACRALNAWKLHGLTLGVSVNVSLITVTELTTANRFATQVRAHGVDPRDITLEVTETDVMTDAPRALSVLARLRMKGFQLAIDDFGTGYSSLQQLNTIPFTELKIDQGFVRNCGRSKRQRNIVRSTIELARRLNIRTVAEGVESSAEWDFLRSCGCDEAQGYYIGHPMAAGEIPAWAGQWRDRVNRNA